MTQLCHAGGDSRVTRAGAGPQMPAWVALPGRAVRRYRRAMQPSSDRAPDSALPTAADVDAAAQRLAGVALHTPLLTSPVLDGLICPRVFLNAEPVQLPKAGAIS